ncbi:hypothetical protein [Trichormus azollae]|uniref:hypothetical protein n=1 Tax=Trichormus azollae TaxID=1164 RepID=UPI000309B609
MLADVNPYVQIPQQLNNLIMSCLEKKPNQLPQNMGEILKVFADIEQSIQKTKITNLETKSLLDNSVTSRNLAKITNQYGKFAWPENKRIQEIVFPQLYISCSRMYRLSVANVTQT